MPNRLAERIKEIRTAYHLTQEEFGKKIGVQKSAVNKYEKGRVDNISRITIETICKTFNVSPQWLLGMEESQSNTADEMIRLFNSLNQEGQEKVMEYIVDLVASGRYALEHDQPKVV